MSFHPKSLSQAWERDFEIRSPSPKIGRRGWRMRANRLNSEFFIVRDLLKWIVVRLRQVHRQGSRAFLVDLASVAQVFVLSNLNSEKE